VSATGVKGGQKLCQRAIPAAFRAVGRCRGNHLPRLVVLAPNQHQGPMRASFGEELVGPVLIRSGVPFPHASGVGLTPCAFQHGEHADEPDRP